MNLIGMSLDGDDEPEHVRVRRVRTRSASTPGFGVAAVMRALAVIMQGGEAASVQEASREWFNRVWIVLFMMMICGLVDGWKLAMLFSAHGVWNQVWMMMIVVVVSASASGDKEMVAHGKFAQQLRDHGDVFIFVVLTVLMFVVLGCMPPRRWGRWQRDLEEPLGPGENQNQLRSRVHAWFAVELLGRPRAEQQSGATSSSTSAAQGPVPQSSHDEDAACYEDWAEAVLVEDNGEGQR